jgi:hypothetical protein
MIRATLVLAVLAAVSSAAGAQATAASCWIRGDAARLPLRASALDSTETRVAGAVVKVCYGRPAARGRPIMGGLVPWGEPWRLGANEATAIHVPFAAEIAGVRVEPGTYSLYAIPGDTTWQIVVNRTPQRWGIPINPQVRAQDVGTGTVRAEALTEPVETFTLRFGPVSGNGTELIAEWERTRVRIPVRRVEG